MKRPDQESAVRIRGRRQEPGTQPSLTSVLLFPHLVTTYHSGIWRASETCLLGVTGVTVLRPVGSPSARETALDGRAGRPKTVRRMYEAAQQDLLSAACSVCNVGMGGLRRAKLFHYFPDQQRSLRRRYHGGGTSTNGTVCGPGTNPGGGGGGSTASLSVLPRHQRYFRRQPQHHGNLCRPHLIHAADASEQLPAMTWLS